MENATPKGKHMSYETFKNAKEFIRYMNPMVLVVSGGEPFEHPNAIQMIEELRDLLGRERIIVASNGTFRFNREIEDRVNRLGVMIQVTNDSRYYPMSVPMNSTGNIVTVNRIETMYPQGRAVENNLGVKGIKTSKCFNLRSIGINNAHTFYEAVKILERAQKFCTPAIGIKGEILIGESSLCSSIGNIDMSDRELLENLRKNRCDKCKLISKLPLHYRKAVNMI